MGKVSKIDKIINEVRTVGMFFEVKLFREEEDAYYFVCDDTEEAMVDKSNYKAYRRPYGRSDWDFIDNLDKQYIEK